MLRTHRTIARKPGFKQFCLLIAAAAAASIPGLCAPPQDDGKTLLAPGLPREAISRSNAFLVAYDGQSYLFNPSAGIVQAPFLRNVYKPFGFSYNSRYVLYLKSNGRLPTFSLYTYDLDTGTDTLLSEDSVQFAAWSPTTLDVAYVAYDGTSEFRVVLLDIASRTKTEVARGYIDPDALDWSADGRQLAFLERGLSTKPGGIFIAGSAPSLQPRPLFQKPASSPQQRRSRQGCRTGPPGCPP